MDVNGGAAKANKETRSMKKTSGALAAITFAVAWILYHIGVADVFGFLVIGLMFLSIAVMSDVN